MLSKFVKDEYDRLRSLEYPASEAHRAALIRESFRDKARLGLIELFVEPDDLMYDDSYVESEGEKKKLWDRINKEGVYVITGRCRLSADDAWTCADSVGGFIGDDWKDSGYDVDIRKSALDMLVELEQKRLDSMPAQATREYVSCQ